MRPPKKPLVERLLDVVEDVYCRKGERKAVVLEAPTGYGKTFAAPFVAERLFKCDYADRFLHVLPLRAIVEDVLCNGKSGLRVRIRRGELRLKVEDVAYQMGERLEGVPKRPLFDARYVVTTLDSFLYNFYKIPVTEIFGPKKHYAIPRLRIFLSGILFDEAHVALGESYWPPSAGSLAHDTLGKGEEGLYSATLAFLEAAVKAGVPVLLASATMGDEALERVAPYSYVVKYGKGGRRGDIEEIYDEDFAGKVRSVKWRTDFIEDKKVVEKALEVVNQGRRVFVAVDNIPKAVEYYRGLKAELGEGVVLLHGALTRGDRAEGLEKLENAKALVATSVVEAGVDVSFDVLITDGRRPRSVVQRAGRVCRRLDCGEAELYLIKEFTDDSVADYVNTANCVNWRNPLDEDGCRGYGALLDKAPLPEGKEVYKFSKLASTLFVASSTLDAILRAREYALFRTALVTVFVDTCNGQEVCIKAKEAVKRSITLDSDRLRAVTRCVKGFYAIDDGEVREVKCDKGADVRSYIQCLKAADSDVAGFVLREECYEPGIGLRPLVGP
ncbi:MAG: DEAD/DEAH box helicase [Thermoproteus sp.]|nr:DEAD/DEAH box helicase [Thermoproteus sp.]